MEIVSAHHVIATVRRDLIMHVVSTGGEGPASVGIPTDSAHLMSTFEQVYRGAAKNSISILSSICIDKVGGKHW